MSDTYGQTWHLNQIKSDEKYKYEYWFHFDNSDDSCSYDFKKFRGDKKSKIRLNDNYGQPVMSARIRLKDTDRDTFINVLDINGLSQIQLGPGKYAIDIAAAGYDRFSLNFSILEKEFIRLSVKLGMTQELATYQINSKVELDESEIVSIINCVKRNRQNFYRICSDRDRYYVLMHI